MAKQVSQRLKIYINGQEVEKTLTNINKSLREFRSKANRATEGSNKWKEYNAEVALLEMSLTDARAAQKAFRQDTKLTAAGVSDAQKELGNFTGSVSTLFSGLKRGDFLQIQEGFKGVKSGIVGATKAGLAFLATPIGIAIAALAGIGIAAKAWFDYNVQVVKALETTTAITGLTDQAANQARIQAETLAEVYGTDFEKNLETAKKLVTQFKISYSEAFNVIEDGLKRGQGKNDEYFESLNEYGAFFKAAGYSATEFKNIISTGYDLGIYKDKLPDAIKEADLAIKEQTKTTKDALVNAFGAAFADDLLKRVRVGQTTTKEALAEIAVESDKANISVQQNAQLTADLFKGAGEDAGGALKVFEAINTSLNTNQKELTESQQLLSDQAEATRKLKTLSSNLFLSGDKGWGLLVDKAKLFGTKILIKILEVGIDVYNWVVDLNNESTVFSAILTGIGNAASTSFKVIGLVLKNAVDAFKGLGTIIAGIFTLDSDKITSGFKKTVNAIPNLIKGIKAQVIADANDITDALSGKNKMKRMSLSDFTEDNTTTTTPDDKPKGSSKTELTDEDNKIIASKKKLKEWLDQWEADNAIQKQIEDLEKDEADKLKAELELEQKYAKLEAEAHGEKELLKKLEDAKKADLEAIDKKYQDKKLKDKIAFDKKYAAADKLAKDNLVKAELKLESAVANAKLAGLQFLRGVVNQKGITYKLLLGLEKALAISEIITSTGKANATAMANELKIPFFLGLGVPNPAKALTLATTSKMIAANKINAATQIASIGATTLRSLDKGGFTFNGPYSGGVDGIGGQLMIGHPEEYMIPKPVMQMPEVPMIVEYLEAKRTGQPINSLASGGAVGSSETLQENIPETSNGENSDLLYQISRLNDHLDYGLKINYTLQDEVERQKLEDELQKTLKNAKQ